MFTGWAGCSRDPWGDGYGVRDDVGRMFTRVPDVHVIRDEVTGILWGGME